jgi:hypothetical protein
MARGIFVIPRSLTLPTLREEVRAHFANILTMAGDRENVTESGIFMLRRNRKRHTVPATFEDWAIDARDPVPAHPFNWGLSC